MASNRTPTKKPVDLEIQITLDEMSSEVKQFVEQVKTLQKDPPFELYDAQVQLINSYSYSLFDAQGETADFNDEKTRRYYLFHYGMGHFLGTHMVLNTMTYPDVCRGYNSWLEDPCSASLKICSIGGGPGIDVFALQSHFKWLKNKIDNTRLSFGPEFRIPAIDEIFILDKCLEWGDTYEFLRQSLDLPTAKYVKFNFGKLLTEEDDGEWRSVLQNADFISMIKFASAVMPKGRHDLVELAQSQLKELVSEMKDGALLLYVDTN